MYLYYFSDVLPESRLMGNTVMKMNDGQLLGGKHEKSDRTIYGKGFGKHNNIGNGGRYFGKSYCLFNQ